MTGIITEKKGYWYIVLNQYDDLGNRKRKWISTGLTIKGNKKKATEMLNKALAKYDGIEYSKPEQSYFSNFLLDWLEIHKSTVQTTTYNGYKHMVDKYMYPYFDERKIKLTGIKPIDIQKYYIYLQNNTGLSSNSILKHHQVIHKCLKYALKNKFVKENAANYVDRPKKTFTEHTFLEISEINELIKCLDGSKIKTPVLFAIYYGLRRSEVLGLTWENIDFDNNLIKIRKKVVRTFDENHKLRIEVSDNLKTMASYREFPLIPEIRQHLLDLKKQIAENEIFFGSEYSQEYKDFICINEKGILLNPDYVSSAYNKLVKKNGLPKSSFQSLRHSCGSVLLKKGFNIKEIQQWLGHSSTKTTSDIYSHTEKSFKNEVGNMLSNTIAYV